MQKFLNRFLISTLVAVLAASNVLAAVRAASVSPAQTAESIRASLVQAQLSLNNDPKRSAALVQDAEAAYQTGLSERISISNPDAHLRIRAAFETLLASISSRDVTSFAAARARVWTGILAGSYALVEQAIRSGDGFTAQTWLPVREFRTATRFSRPNIEATVAVERFISGDLAAGDVLLSVQADLLDTYQARMTESLRDLQAADTNGFASRRAELATLAEGYFLILAPAYLDDFEQAVIVARAGYEAGRGTFLALVDSQRVLLDARLDVHRARAEKAQALADLERAVGVDFSTENRPAGRGPGGTS